MTPRLETLKEALAVSPDNAPLLLLYGQACLDELEFAEARTTFERVLKFDSANRDARLGVCRALYLSGTISEAVVRTEALLQNEPRFGEAWMLLSRLALAEQNDDQASEYYQRAIQLNPSLRDPAVEKDLTIERPIAQRSEETYSDDGEWEEVDEGDFVEADTGEVEQPESSFADVGGMEEVKEEIRMKIIYPLHNRDLFRAYGKKIGGGVLLYGPPGCGKTLISKATAGEIKANFISLGIHQILDMWLGNSEKQLHQVFQLARDNAPAILFFDEVDALAANRKDVRHAGGLRSVINQFLAEMDGNVGSNEGVLVLGATNAPWDLDPAFRRPGRFDRVIFVPPPDEPARESIIEILARDKPMQRFDIKAVAKRTRDFSGADLKAVFDIATERVLSRAMKEGRVVPLNTDDLLQVVKGMKPSTRAWFESAKNYALYANQGGFYDDVLSFLGIKK
jgi:transitional endoplasmic reticulum ATPase